VGSNRYCDEHVLEPSEGTRIASFDVQRGLIRDAAHLIASIALKAGVPRDAVGALLQDAARRGQLLRQLRRDRATPPSADPFEVADAVVAALDGVVRMDVGLGGPELGREAEWLYELRADVEQVGE
jgi:hypothetical protein